MIERIYIPLHQSNSSLRKCGQTKESFVFTIWQNFCVVIFTYLPYRVVIGLIYYGDQLNYRRNEAKSHNFSPLVVVEEVHFPARYLVKVVGVGIVPLKTGKMKTSGKLRNGISALHNTTYPCLLLLLLELRSKT